MKLSFSTRGWADHSWDELVSTALEMDFSGIEIHNPIINAVFTGKGGPLERYNTQATARALRDKGLRVIVHAGNPGFKNQFKRADQSMAQWCLIAGESEVAEGKLTVKHLRDAAGNQVFEDQLTLPEGEALARVTR